MCIQIIIINEEFYTNILLNINKITFRYGDHHLLESLLNIIIKNRLNNELKFNYVSFHKIF